MFRRLFRLAVRRPKIADEVAAEVDAHLEMKVDALRAQGWSEEAARAEALRQFGSRGEIEAQCRALQQTREVSVRRRELWGSLWLDLRHAARALRRSPAFSVAAALTLALGIGVNTAMFTVTNALLLRPLPGMRSDGLFLIWDSSPQAAQFTVSYPDYLDWRARGRGFQDIAVFNPNKTLTLTGTGEPERIDAATVSANYFAVLDAPPALGRVFVAGDDQPGAAGVVVLSHGCWRRRFGQDPSIVGRPVMLDGRPFTVVGIMPRRFAFPNVELWAALGPFVDSVVLARENHPGLVGIARIKPGLAAREAQRDLDRVSRELGGEYPRSNKDQRGVIQPVQEAYVGSVRSTVLLLAGAVGMILLIACSNVANLMLAHVAGRERDFAIRAALGAAGGRVLRLLLAESLLLALAGGLAGVGLAWWGTSLLRSGAQGILPRAREVSVDPLVLAYAAVLVLVTACLFGLLPLWRPAGRMLTPSLAVGRGAGEGRRQHLLRRSLVSVQVALSLMLLVGAGLLIRSFVRVLQVKPGFEPSRVLVANVSLPVSKYPGDESGLVFFTTLLERVRAIPGVEAAAVVDPLPFGDSGWQTGLVGEGMPPALGDQGPLVDAAVVTPDYFVAMGIPLLAGRFFTPEDRRGAPGVVILSQELARRFWPGKDPVGRRVKQGAVSSATPWLTVVGLVGDVHQRTLEPDRGAGGTVYFPMLQQSARALTLVAKGRGAGDPAALAPTVRRELAALDPELPLYGVSSLGALVRRSLAQRRLVMLLLAGFAALAAVLAGIGIYGVTAHLVAGRRREIGVRLALGAAPGAVVRQVLSDGLLAVWIGVALGLAGATALSRLLARLLFEVKPLDPLTIGSVSLGLVLVATAAAWLPARRAAAVHPMETLRVE